MWICTECRHIFDDDDVAIWEESRGEYWGMPCYEEVSGCPRCKGDYVKTYRCSCCDEWLEGPYIKTDNGKRYCSECFQDYVLGDED